MLYYLVNKAVFVEQYAWELLLCLQNALVLDYIQCFLNSDSGCICCVVCERTSAWSSLD